MGGPDAGFSLTIEEFAAMVRAVRDTEMLLGKVTYALSEKSKKSREFSRSLFVAEDISEGEKITEENVRSVRPGFGMHPKLLQNILGKTVNSDLKKGEPMKEQYITL